VWHDDDQELSGKTENPRLPAGSDSGQPGGGAGRIDIVGKISDGVRIDPDVTEGHPGYEESGSSEIVPVAPVPDRSEFEHSRNDAGNASS
jgi:hypothetical protein